MTNFEVDRPLAALAERIKTVLSHKGTIITLRSLIEYRLGMYSYDTESVYQALKVPVYQRSGLYSISAAVN